MFGYNFKLHWKGDNFKFEAGDFNADVDTKAVAAALISAGTVVGNKANILMQLSAASLGTYFAVQGAKKAWSWLEVTDPPKKNILQLSAPEDKKAEFDKLIDGGELKEKMDKNLQNPRQIVRNDLGDSVDDATVNELVKRLTDIHLSSLTRCDKGSSFDEAGLVVEGECKKKSHNQLIILAPSDKPGTYVGQHIKAGARAEFTHYGGMEIIGGNKELHKHAVEAATGNLIKVSLKFSDYSTRFEGKYKPDQILYDVIGDVKRHMEKGDTKFKHIIDKAGERLTDEDVEISEFEKRNWLKTLTVVVE